MAKITEGGGLHYFPPGREERDLRELRRRQIREARRHRERIVVDGRRYWLVRLPDGRASDYAVQEEDDAA